MKAKALIKLIQRSLTPDLLQPAYVEKNKRNPMYGHCYAASEALYHLLGGKEAGLKPVSARDSAGIVHWWLQTSDGEILDPTADQYYSKGLTPPYASGRGRGFQTKKPSKRAQKIMRRVRGMK